jgi:hypothetical protein
VSYDDGRPSKGDAFCLMLMTALLSAVYLSIRVHIVRFRVQPISRASYYHWFHGFGDGGMVVMTMKDDECSSV